MFNKFYTGDFAGKQSTRNIALALLLSLSGSFASHAYAECNTTENPAVNCDHANSPTENNNPLKIKISPESKIAKVDESTEIVVSVSKEKIPAPNAKIRWTQFEGPGTASLFPGTGKTNAKGLSQLRVQVHTPGEYKFLAEVCDDAESKTFCEHPAKAVFDVTVKLPIAFPAAENVLFGAAIASPLVGATNTPGDAKVKFASLTAQTSTDINGAVNTNIPLSAVYLYGETGFTGQSVNWVVSPAATLSASNTPVTGSDGLVSINFQSAASGTYFVTATGTCPGNLSADVCAPPSQTFRIRINAPALVNISGNSQSAGVGQALIAPLVVQAQNAGVGTPGVSVNWTVVSGSATLGAVSSASNSVGLASNTVTMGATAGPVVIRAERADAASAFVLFTVNAVNAQLTRASPATMSGSSSGSFNLTTFSNYGGIANGTGQINWSSSIPGQTSFSSASTAIDAAGRSNVTVSTTQGGSYTITACWNPAGGACVAGNPSTTFTINSNSLRIVSGNSQALIVSQSSAPLAVQLLSGGFANPQTITWSVTGPATLTSATTSTDGAGNSSNNVIFTGAGAAVVKASWPPAAGQPKESVSFNLSSTANSYRLTPNSALNVTGSLGVPVNLNVDYNFNGAAATSLLTQWSIVSGPGGGVLGSTTATVAANADSVNTFTPTIAGTYIIRAQGGCPASDPDCPTNAVEFSISTGVLSQTLYVSSGDNQAAPVNTAFASPLIVLANDNGAPVSGVTIDWVVTAGDSILSSGTSVTDVSGFASINVTSGPSNGLTTITATRQDAPSVSVSFNLDVGTTTFTLAPNGSNNIDLPLGYGIYLSANYTINGIPAVGQNVLWSTASGFLTATSVPVDAGGNATTIYFPPYAAGVYTVTADGDCPPGPAPILGASHNTPKGSGTSCPPPSEIFTITVIDKTLQINSGDAQSTPLATPYSSPITVQALNDGVPVAGVDIYWTITSGSGTLTSASPSTTDASGIATMTLDAGNVAGTITVEANRGDVYSPVNFNLQATGNVYALATVSPNDITININDIANLDVNYVVNGVGDTSLETLWSTSGGTLGSSNSPVDSAGDSTNTFTSASVGTYTVTVDGSCPASPDPACPIAAVTFTIHVVDPNQTITLHAGNNQTTPLGTTFPNTIVVLAEDSGVAVSDVQINWTLTSGDAILSSGTSLTDSSGFAQINVDATGNAGAIQITATRDDSGTSVVFDLTSTFAATLDVISGDNQSGPQNTPAGLPIRVRLSNGGGIGLPDVNIDWTLLSGDAVLGSSSTVTDGSGYAEVTFDFGNTVGPIQIQASTSGFGLSLITNHNVLATIPTLSIASGDGQNTAPNTPFSAPLVVLAQNSGSPASGVIIDWAVTSGDATLSAAASTTDGAGNAPITVNAGVTPGPVVVTGTRNDAPTETVTFTLNINTSALAITRTSGNGQAAFINTAFASPLVVNATNSGIAAAGVQINWVLASGTAVLSSGTSNTDASGAANITVSAGNVVGPISITATRNDEPTAVVTFSLTADPTPNGTLTIVSGDGQSGVIGSTANSPITVVLRDGFGNPLSGQAIAWSVVSGPASVNAASSNTDASGQANTTFTFGTSGGAVVLRASALAGTLTVDFNATAVMVTLAPASGDGQAGAVSTALPVPLTVQISPPAGVFSVPGTGKSKPKALSGVPVTFAVTGGGGSVSVTNTVTNGAGQASTILTLGPTAGINTVSATILGGPTVNFSATALTAAVASGLTIVSGNNQVLDPSITSSPLTVELRDSVGNVIVGATINWTTTGGTLATASSVTNASGQASNTIQINGLGTVQVSANAPAFGSAPVVFNLNLAISNLTGLNPLQTEIANAIDNLCPALAAAPSLTAQQNDLLQQCQNILGSAGIDPQATIGALDELFSDVALAQGNATLFAAQAQFQNLKARIAALRSGTGGTSFGGLALNTSAGSVPVSSLLGALSGESNSSNAAANNSGDFERWGFFASGSIGRGEADAASINPAFDYDINGLTAGVDYRMSDKLILGAAVGFTKQGTTLPGSAGSVDTTGWNASAYSTFYQQNNWYADAVLTYGQNSFDLQRHVNYTLPLFGGGFTTVDQIANAKSDGSMLSATITFGRDFQHGGWAIGPYGRMTYTKLDFDAYDEHLLNGNGSGLGLHIEDRSLTSLASVIGSKFAYSHSTSWGVLMPHFQFEWEREYKDDPQTVQASFIYDPTGTLITVTGNPEDKSYFRVGLGLSMIMSRGRSGFIYYEKMLGRDKIEQDTLSLGLRMEF